MNNLLLKTFLFLIGITYLLISVEYINADGYEHIRRLCNSQLGIENWAYYDLVSYINKNILKLDSCEYFNTLDESIFNLNIIDVIQQKNHLSIINYGKILVALVIWFSTIFFILNRNNIIELSAIVTSPFLFFSLLSSSSDVFVSFFSLILFLYLNKKNFIISILLIGIIMIYTDKSSLYVLIVFFYLLLVDKFKIGYKVLIPIFIIQFLFLEIIKIIPQILNFNFIYDLNIYDQYISNLDHGRYFLFAFPVTIFSTPNLKLVNIIGLIIFILTFFYNIKYLDINFFNKFLCYFIPFYLIASLIGGVSMARHYPLFAIFLVYSVIKISPVIISSIFIITNIIFILITSIIYLNL